MSQPCRALLIFLKVNNIPFESKVVALRKGEHLTSEFAKLNPFQKVPVMEHKDFVLTESIAMVRYLAKEFPIEDKWYPKDSKAQARVDEYLEWQHLNTRLFGSMVFRQRVIEPLLQQKPVDEKKVEFYKKGFLRVVKDIEEGFLKNRPYISGDNISVADIFCACEIEQPLMIGFDALADVPKVKNWFDKIRIELEPHYSEVHNVTKIMKGAIEKGKL
ncbi:glutathione S-transferase theta-1 [Trichonephila inaurata madagascariensis]|uniref:Glutathione S-transferase theta-1 n=1 Tax=Trichonephila inaurata madagascariensis TaxID=2747483 RepID=A0A8X6YRQ1_9ARAC|nr:glutathione S-transferase theta-1 [Trichonephila inaurata madagascariensis]